MTKRQFLFGACLVIGDNGEGFKYGVAMLFGSGLFIRSAERR